MKILGLIGASLLLITSCIQKPQNDGLNPLLRMSKNLISTRPQNSKQFFAILKLQSPALLESGRKEGGRVVVDQDLLKQVTAEQDEAIAALKALSPEVQVIYKYSDLQIQNGSERPCDCGAHFS
jgi:hypothetical protein